MEVKMVSDGLEKSDFEVADIFRFVPGRDEIFACLDICKTPRKAELWFCSTHTKMYWRKIVEEIPPAPSTPPSSSALQTTSSHYFVYEELPNNVEWNWVIPVSEMELTRCGGDQSHRYIISLSVIAKSFG
ncbi:hypothetical protein RvY_10214 [Ramazzottius varieornatus]|uniref:Uncharacterized protein n=1 Tax=Ramazzottius varieornatus TaxID=947166 RepID=A0A1D1VL19_RAMVA|nr:hypothetical protein RvY_10214 [Ramazzottius varieornatus]